MLSGRPWCAFARHLSVLMISVGALCAQDPFEIHVLEYEQLKPGEFTFENHLNYVAPSVFHDTYELTAGIADDVSIGVMQLNARRPGGPLESAGWRLVPHLYVPRSWHLPVDLGLVVEIAFENAAWNADTRSVTILPVLEKHFGRLQLDLNPTFGRSLHGPDTDRGWGLGLAGRVAFEQTKRLTPSLEYYGGAGALPAFMHQILPGADIHLRKNVIWSVGVGFGLSPATDRLVLKSRLEVSFGGKTRH
jgi:hypothetical protein